VGELVVSTLSREEARSLTDEVKHDAERLWSKMVELHDGDAHGVLGYTSWHAYCAEEFGMGQAHAYRLLHSGQVLAVIPRDNPKLSSERQARELAPLLDQPEQLREAWSAASKNGQPTAKEVRAIVQKHAPEVKQEVIRRCCAGERQNVVARELGISESAVSNWMRHVKKLGGANQSTRRTAGTPTSRILQDLQKLVRRWETLAPDEWINVSEAARRARVLGEAIAFLETHRAEYASQGHKLLVKGEN
jgi:transposase-like protein